jgi:hypothetical protein
VKTAENFAKYTLALGATRPNSAVASFFRKYEFAKFAHDPAADPQAEFDRLQAARKWGDRKLKKIREEFLTVLGAQTPAAPSTASLVLERLPIVEFLKARQCAGYRYGSGPPEDEFKALMEAHKRNWTREENRMGRNPWSEAGKERLRISCTELQEPFHEAIEEQLDMMLELIAGGEGLRGDEVMAELYCVGKAPLSKDAARTVRLHFS